MTNATAAAAEPRTNSRAVRMEIQLNGGQPIHLDCFAEINEIDDDDLDFIYNSLFRFGYYRGGGGAAAEYTLVWPHFVGPVYVPRDLVDGEFV